MENMRVAHKALVGKLEGKRRLAKPRCRCKGNIKLIFKEWNGDMGWIDLAKCKDRWWGSCECGNDPLGCIKCGEFVD
jgi:hypothetical protein